MCSFIYIFFPIAVDATVIIIVVVVAAAVAVDNLWLLLLSLLEIKCVR